MLVVDVGITRGLDQFGQLALPIAQLRRERPLPSEEQRLISGQSNSRSLNFWILVADIGHSVTKRISRGSLKFAT